MALVNEKLDLVQRKEEMMAEQLKGLKNGKENVNEKSLNKMPKNWPYSAYLNCFYSSSLEERIKYLIPTVAVKVIVNGKEFGPIKAMLDSGAQPTLVSARLYNVFKCPTATAMRRMIGIDASPFTIRRKFELCLKPWFDSDISVKETVWVLPEENAWNPTLPSTELNVSTDLQLEQQLADPKYAVPMPVDIVLGVGFFAKILERLVGTAPDGTMLFETRFGTIVMGEHTEPMDPQTGSVFTTIDDKLGDKLNGMLEKLWEQDEIGLASGMDSPLTTEEQMVEDQFMSTHYREPDGRFVVRIPFKEGVNCIGSSRQVAIKRFLSIERKLADNKDLKEFYIGQMNELMENGHMVEANRAPAPGKICYHIPHHCVTKKPRVVYDASCKTNFGISLNEVQLLGAKMQSEMNVTIMHFRGPKFVWTADIKKMFNQIKINEEQWDCQRIFWRENSDEPLKEYWLTVVTFGLMSSAFLAVRCLIQAAREAAEQFPRAAKAIERDFYMDDGATGDDTVEGAITLAKEIDQILSGAGFKLRKWKSNDVRVLHALDAEEDMDDSMVFSGDGDTSVLGVKWLVK